MPREVQDIKQFIEICRRKDAKCESHPLNIQHSTTRQRGGDMLTPGPPYSRTHKTQRAPDQVQSPMSSLSVHVGIEGFGKGG